MFRDSHLGSESDRLFLAVGPNHGPPILFLHGVLRCWRDFLPLFAPWSTRWQLHGLDFRGHGLSAPQTSYLVTDYVEDAGRALRSLDQPAVVYGHSLGAMVALAAAAQFPDHVSAVVLEDPPFETMGNNIANSSFQSLFEGIRREVHQGKEVDSLASRLAEVVVHAPGTEHGTRLGDVRDGAALRFSARCLSMIDDRVLDPIVEGRWLEGYDFRELAGRVKRPTLVLQGDLTAGGMLTPNDATELSRLVPGAIVVPFTGIGHLIHWQARERALSVTGNFLESLR